MAQTTEQYASGTVAVREDTRRSLLVKILQATTAGGSGGASVFTGTGNPNGVQAAPVGSIYNQISGGGVLIATFTKLTGVGNTGWG
jgi:hypothetical protein